MKRVNRVNRANRANTNRTELRKKILAANDAAAARLRQRFAETGTLVIDLVSSPGAGKTSLLEATVRRMAGELELGVIVGDVATELDAERLRRAGCPARQIVTGGACHLDARMVTDALDALDCVPIEVLFLENVGNLVCPAAYDLGEDFKVALLSVAEGDDKPFKYPAVFAKAGVTVVTKIDLLGHAPFDLAKAGEQVMTLNPGARVVPLSVFDGWGMDAWCELLRGELRAKRASRTRLAASEEPLTNA